MTMSVAYISEIIIKIATDLKDAFVNHGVTPRQKQCAPDECIVLLLHAGHLYLLNIKILLKIQDAALNMAQYCVIKPEHILKNSVPSNRL